MLASIGDETLTTVAANHWTMFDGLDVPDQVIGTLPARSAGAYFTSITGIADGTVDSPTLMPRVNADIVDGTAPARTVEHLHETDDCIELGDTNAPVALVKLSGPASQNTVVTMSSDHPGAVSVPDVTVAPGTDTAVVRATGQSPASNIILGATIGSAPAVGSDGFLEVRDPNSNRCATNSN